MTELQSILHACTAAQSRAADALLATVVHVEGSTYRRPGARKLLTSDGQSLGLISGGCLESAVRRKAFWLTAQNAATVVRYDTSAGEDVALEFGLGCQGIVDVLLERFPASVLPPALDQVRQALTNHQPCLLATVVASSNPNLPIGTKEYFALRAYPCDDSAPVTDLCVATNSSLITLHSSLRSDLAATAAERRSRSRNYETPSGSLVIFIEYVAPPTHLLIIGAGLDAPAVVHIASSLGWETTVVDPRAAYIAPSRFPTATRLLACPPADLLNHVSITPSTAAVIMTHHAHDDLAALRTLLPANLAYLGLLGPRVRTDRLLEELARTGFSATPQQHQSLHAPIGLDLGAETPEEIALAIVAEITATLRGHPAGPLKNRAGPIHRPPLSESPIAPNTQNVSCPI